MIFVWKDFTTWRIEAQKSLSPKLSKVLEQVPVSTYAYPDDICTLRKLIKVDKDYFCLLADFTERFFESVQEIRAYHCCKAQDICSFLRDGIRMIPIEELLNRFEYCIAESRLYPRLTAVEIRKAASRRLLSSRQYELRVHLGLDDRFLIKFCGHYLIYGSESFQVIAREIESSTSYDIMSLLRTCGLPTVFEINVPVNKLDPKCLKELAENVLYTFAYNSAKSITESRLLDFGIGITENIPSSWIDSYYHPESVPDPFSRK